MTARAKRQEVSPSFDDVTMKDVLSRDFRMEMTSRKGEIPLKNCFTWLYLTG
jgi:hypothetical protein